jgi:hypothetical protein
MGCGSLQRGRDRSNFRRLRVQVHTLRRPSRNHHWRFGISGPLRYAPYDGIETPARILSDAEIRALGYVLVEADHEEILEARRMCQRHHPDRGGDPAQFRKWKHKLDKLRRRV